MAAKLEAIQRKCLWGSFGADFNYYLVRWDIVKLSMLEGGLRIRNLKIFNEALLGKWLWRFMNEKTNHWRRVICTKYGEERLGWFLSRPNGPYGVSLWRFICKGWDRFFPHLSVEWVLALPYFLGMTVDVKMLLCGTFSLLFMLLRRIKKLLWLHIVIMYLGNSFGLFLFMKFWWIIPPL